MAREIKFRAWDKKDTRMIVHEQDFIPLKVTNIGVLRLDATSEEEKWTIVSGDRFELMQYTGLKDCRGKEIYEGDIVSTKYSDTNHVVKYFGYNFYADGFYNSAFDCPGDLFSECDDEDIEVIGNIYENPELLPQEQDTKE